MLNCVKEKGLRSCLLMYVCMCVYDVGDVDSSKSTICWKTFSSRIAVGGSDYMYVEEGV